MHDQEPSASYPGGAGNLLAKRADFRLGNAVVRPSLRMIEGPQGSVRGEPRVVQVLVALADAKGVVLSREDLIRLCWNNRIVGDDAINRAIAEVRRVAASVGADFEVETVPRVGYRLAGLDCDAAAPVLPRASHVSKFDRRTVGVAGIAALAVAAVGGTTLWTRRRESSQADALIERGRVLQGSGLVDGARRAEAVFRQVIALDPDRADAWGWLAVVLGDFGASREAAARALELDPREPNARTVLAYQRRDLDAWTQWEDDLLGVIHDAPSCAFALNNLTFFYQGMGRCAESRAMNDRAVRAEPFNPIHQYRRATKHWIFGSISEADKVADRALQLWPRNAAVWNARLIIYAFTNRAPAALALLDDVASRPTNLTPAGADAWRAGLGAIATRRRADIEQAVAIGTAAAKLGPGLAANAIMTFSYLGEVDAAYRVAEGLFDRRGEVIQRNPGAPGAGFYATSNWGRTQFLFIPATNAFRADPRFSALCERMGHVAYWRARGIWPDPFVRGSLVV